MDEVKASMLGWTTKSFPDLNILHHRYTGTAEGLWAGLVKNGRANYIAATITLSAFQMLASACPKALRDWIDGTILWIHLGVREAHTPSE